MDSGDKVCSEDAELLKTHLAKNTIVFEETQHLLQGLSTQLAALDTGMQDLERRISTLQELVRIRELCKQLALKLQSVEQKLALTKSQVYRTTTKRKGLREQQKRLVRTMSALQPALTLERFREAPIRRLPVDVLAEIFRPPDILPLGTGSLSIVSRVCRWWRAVVLEHPTFWASFSLSLNDSIAPEWLAIYLERSRTVPSTIDFQATGYYWQWGVTSTELQVLAAHAERLENFTLRGTQWDSLGLRSFEVVGGSGTSFTNGVLEEMTMLPGRPGILPGLKRLRVEGRTLEDVRLHLSKRTVKKEAVERLRALRGVNLSLVCLNAEKRLVTVL
ncbi:hypothetical protein C8R46DRAFT_1318167 [Mycena filopes]|nr:hypothetical protein C8R46DRAFT_1318167 [Mycena filopes]